jgi:primosomal protein N' (replication factor Y)
MYAEIALDVPVYNTFHYHIPDNLAGQIAVGHLVQVGFRTAQQQGIVVGLQTHSDIVQTKPVLALLDPRPVVTPPQIALARWMSQRYLTPLGACLWQFVPSGLTGRRDIQVTLLRDATDTLNDLEALVIALLTRRGPLLGQQLTLALPGKDWRGAISGLAKAGIIRVENVLTAPRARPKLIRTAALAVHPQQIDALARHLGRPSKQADLLEVIAAAGEEGLEVERALRIAETTPAMLKKLEEVGLVATNRHDRTSEEPLRVWLLIPRESVDENLIALRKGERLHHILRVLARENEPMDVSWLYAQTDAKLSDLKRLEEEGLVLLGENESWRDSLAKRDFVPSMPPPLTPEQQAVWQVIEARIKAWDWNHVRSIDNDADERQQHDASGIFLLHGVTGSGKTEIYLRAIEQTLAQGRQAFFLVPEIALTPQTMRRVAARFPGQVAVVHSKLSDGERYDTWRRARDGLIGVVVGSRSALFTPFPDPGLIILDEEHDHSYKQGAGSNRPYYHARDVAEYLMRHNHGVLILGSATPDVETYFRAQRGDLRLLRLPNRIMGHRTHILEQAEREGIPARYYPASAADAVTIDLPTVQMVDMRAELKAGNTSIFSRALEEALGLVLERREQAMLFLNRRGQNTYVFCRDCGYVARCPNCDLPAAYHGHDGQLRCHQCGYHAYPPQVCPACQSRRIKYFGAGTQQVEQELTRLFPLARVLRWDADTARTLDAHEELLQQFIDHKADIIIGTQMVTKGLDLPLVTLVGMVSADVGLNLPDFRAGERTFQLLTQVAGRAGRGLLGGRAVLQTYQPDHYVIETAAEQNYERFFQREIAYRREFGYPPFRRLARIVFQHAQENRARAEAEQTAAWLRQRIVDLSLTGTEMIGPAPCFFGRINNMYRWHLLLRSADPTLALAGLDPADTWQIDLDPVSVL